MRTTKAPQSLRRSEEKEEVEEKENDKDGSHVMSV